MYYVPVFLISLNYDKPNFDRTTQSLIRSIYVECNDNKPDSPDYSSSWIPFESKSLHIL